MIIKLLWTILKILVVIIVIALFLDIFLDFSLIGIMKTLLDKLERIVDALIN